MKRASREGWKSAASAAMSATGITMPAPQQGPTMPLSAKVRNGAETAANAIAADQSRSRSALHRLTRISLESRVKRAKKEPIPIESAQDVRHMASVVEPKAEQTTPVVVNVALLSA